MIGLFRVHYFDPISRALNQQACTVSAINAEQAIKRANRQKYLRKYRVERVECLGFAEDDHRA